MNVIFSWFDSTIQKRLFRWVLVNNQNVNVTAITLSELKSVSIEDKKNNDIDKIKDQNWNRIKSCFKTELHTEKTKKLSLL